MQNRWVSVSRVLLPLEGAAGMLLNGVLIYYLAIAKMDRSARLYQISCVISAVISFTLAFLEMVIVDSGELVDGFLIGVCYGPLLLIVSPHVADILCVAFLTQIHTLWQVHIFIFNFSLNRIFYMVPAPSVLQFLSLTNRPMSNFTRMALAYSAPLFFYLISMIVMILIIPTNETREEMVQSAIRVHGTNRSEFHAVGTRLFDEGEGIFSVADIVVFDVIPSFTASYVLFSISMLKIRAVLTSLGGGQLSAKTVQMQRRFFRLQIAQVILPLILPSIPMGVLTVFVLLGQEFTGMSFFLNFVLQPIPIFSALLFLGFLADAENTGKTAKNSTSSKISATSLN